MASSNSSLPLFPCLFLAVAAVTSTIAATEFQVGDAVRWRIPAANETQLYNVWASRRRFHIGDSLRFHYKNDSVAVVEKWGFYHCDPSNPISFFNDGDTVINLDKEGTMYFISGNADRCKQGQNMMVEVMSPHPISYFPPSISSAPQSAYSLMAPSPSQFSSSTESSSSASSHSLTVTSVCVYAMVFIVSIEAIDGFVSCCY